MNRLSLFGMVILLALCSCQQATPKQMPEDNKQDSTQDNYVPNWDCIAGSVEELQSYLRDNDSVKIASQTNFPLEGYDNMKPVTKEIFLEDFQKLFSKEVRAFITSINFDSLKTNREVDLEYFSNRGFDNEYLESDRCKDGIQLRIADDNKSFYLNINNNVYLEEESSCAESSIMIQFFIEDKCKFRLARIQLAG